MCGFVGIKNYESNEFAKLINNIDNCSKLINHRGPDDTKKWISKNKDICLSFNRLSILDTSENAMQPMFSRSKKYIMVFNGEIYNYVEIKNNLSKKNILITSNSDSEVLINHFEHFGIKNTLREINGMFSIVLINLDENSTFLIRDRMGKKPLYWSFYKNTLYFASQIKSIFNFNNFNKDIDIKTLNNYFKFGYINNYKSIFSNINKIKPGSFVKIDKNKKITEEIYWKLDRQKNFENKFNDTYSQFKNILIDSVKIRTRSDVPIGCFLSGGLDSSVIAIILKKFLNTNATFFTAAFEDGEFNESYQARGLSRILGLEHKDILVSSKDCLDIINDIPTYFDEPFADFSSIPSLAISKLTSQNVKVVLTGDGGDETFGGYNRYKAYLFYKKYGIFLKNKYFKKFLNKISIQDPKFFDKIQKFIPSKYRSQFLHDKLIKFNKILDSKDDLDFYKKTLFAWGDESEAIFNNKIISDNDDLILNKDQINDGSLKNLQLLDFNNYLVNDILVKIDRSTMAHGLEARSPFLDHRLVNFGYNIKDNFKINSGKTKILLRKFLKENISDINFNRPKKGFTFPLQKWLREDLKNWANELIYENNYVFIDKKNIIKKWEEHKSGERNWHYQIWTYLMFASWYNKWI